MFSFVINLKLFIMEAKELRIGNILLCAERDIPYRVTAEDILVIDDGSSKSRPVPLTEEILLKCGFEKVIVENFPIYLYDGFMIEIYSDNCVVCYNNSEITKIKFVHSLQNLYFSIKLKELLCDNI